MDVKAYSHKSKEVEYVSKLSRLFSRNKFSRERFLDIFFGLTALIFFLPLMVLIAIAIKLYDRGPIIYVQERIGYKGQRFKMFKFRTMYIDADKHLESLLKNPVLRKEWEKYRKLKQDPRVTPIGKFLRKFSLDELPQVFNVIKGDMSIVGPRPYLPEEEHLIGEYKDIILSVKPGITGKWQVEGRNEISFKERLEMDVWYVKNRSFWLDLKIILKTVKVMFTGKGAY